MNFENKYEFPPPVDNALYFGTCILVAHGGDNAIPSGLIPYVSITPDSWTRIYTKLYGGFENLADTAISDEFEPDPLQNIPPNKLTKTGYLKDGFVVDDEYVLSDISESESDVSSVGIGAETEEIVVEVSQPKFKKRRVKPGTSVRHIPIISEELTQEEYV